MFRTSASENASPLLGVPGEELQQSSLDVRGETRRLEKPEGLRHPGLFLPNTCWGDLMSRRTSQHKNASSGSCTTMRHSSLSSSPSCVALGGRICWPQRRACHPNALRILQHRFDRRSGKFIGGLPEQKFRENGQPQSNCQSSSRGAGQHKPNDARSKGLKRS